MSGLLTGWNELTVAFALFLASHLIPARPAIRDRIVGRLGKAAYLATYSVLSIVLLGWLVVAAGRAPYVALWDYSPWQSWVPNLVMPFACLLLAFGIAAPNPLSIAGRDDRTFNPDRPGIIGVARHPVLWAASLWAFAHAVPNGNLAHVLLFGVFGAFGLAGMLAIDARNRRLLGLEEWNRLSRSTSLLPLAALAAGRWHPSIRDIDMLRVGMAAALYLGLLALHELVIGVSPFPPR